MPVSAWWVARDVLELALVGVGCSPLPCPKETRYASAQEELALEVAASS